MFNMNSAKYNLDEVVFANRNQAYGAYAIRKQYSANINKSIFIVLSTLIVLPVASYFKSSGSAKPPIITKADLQEQVKVLTIVLEPLRQAASSAVSSTTASSANNNNFRITADKNIVKPFTAAAVIDNPVSTKSLALGAGPSIDKANLLGALPGHITSPILPAKQTVQDVVDVMPTFSYGNGDLYAYLQKMMSYPEIARRVGREGKVLVMFEVDEHGVVRNVVIENSIGYGCDEEAIRVVSNMPKWNPGIHQGVPVPVRMRLPIAFKLN